MTVLIEAVCRDCGVGFQYDREYFKALQLFPPARCRACRLQRRDALEEGAIEVFHGSFGFVHGDTGESFYFTLADFGADAPMMVSPGQRVRFLPGPGEPSRRARRLRLLADADEQGEAP